MRILWIGTFVATATLAVITYGRPAVRAYHAYSICEDDGYWHAVTDAIHDDGTVTRVHDQATAHPCKGDKAEKAPQTKPTEGHLSTNMKDCNSSFIDGVIWQTECINDQWYNIKYDRRVCADGTYRLENPEYHATNQPCDQPPPPFDDTKPGEVTIQPLPQPAPQPKPGGVKTSTKIGLAAGAAAAGAIVIAKAHGGSPDTGTTPSTPGVDLTPLFGTFNISATKSTDTGCNFSPAFAGQVQISANKDGTAATLRMIERLTRVYSGQVQSSGTYSGTGTGNLDGFVYNGTIAGQIGTSGGAISGTETLNFTAGCPGKTVIYQFSGNK